MPAAGASTVACPADAVAPTPPTVLDNCGRTLTVSAGVPGADPACAGTKTYTFTYTLVITQLIHGYILIPSVHRLLQCLQLVLQLLPVLLMQWHQHHQLLLDNCGRTLTVSAGVPGADPACAGTKTYTFTYTLVITQLIHGYILIPSVHQLLQCLQLVLLLLPVLLMQLHQHHQLYWITAEEH